MNGILGKKIGMTQIFDESGVVTPVTVVEAGPCLVTQVKTPETDGYTAVQLAFDPIEKDKLVTSPMRGTFKDSDWKGATFSKEFRLDSVEGIEKGASFSVDIFEVGQKITVSGVSRGKGFLGVVGRHGFSGGPASHGSMTHRRPGSIGMAAYPARVIKGMKMAGHTGSKVATVSGLTVAKVDTEKNYLFVKGAVPGAPGTYLKILKQG